ncbi:MAG: hypothetical protein QOK45_2923 [Mycobacterium sp.]|nr:hypothetical protein [Mycobacterium sp.]
MNYGLKGQHPPVDPHVIHLDATLGQQLLDVAIGRGVPQVPAHRDRDYLAREAVAGRSGTGSLRVDHPISLWRLTTIDQRNTSPNSP